MLLRRYTFKLYPNAVQEAALAEQARMCAQLWNALLEMRETFYRRAKLRGDKKTSLTAFDQGRDLTELRAALPEWRAMPRGTQERVCGDLDLAFKSFFRRAKAGAGAQSGYPRFKSVRRADAIPLREPVKSCWTFENTAHSGPARKSEPNGGDESSRARGEEGIWRERMRRACASSRARGEEGSSCDPGPGTIRSSRARGEEGIASRISAPLTASSRARGAGPSGAWRFQMRGIPGAIKARGRFPANPASFKTADIMFRDGAWWLSICVTFDAARIVAGSEKLTIRLNLIDEFASVEDANGRCAPGLTNPFLTERKGEFATQSKAMLGVTCGEPALMGETQATCASPACAAACGEPALVGETQADRRSGLGAVACRGPALVGEAQVVEVAPIAFDAIQSQTDRRFKRLSIRWTRGRDRAARISAKDARRRRDALHRWTSAIIRSASDLTVIAPAIKDSIRSGRGNAQFHGAQVKTIAALNRRVMEQAPAAAIAMLAYKAEEAGVRCDIVRDASHEITIGRDLRATAIAGRKAAKKLRTQKGK